MIEAAKIRDVAARHAYVFDNGLSSPDFFDVEKRMASEEFELLKDRVIPHQSILEVGCFTGLNLLGLSKVGCTDMTGVDFVHGAIDWFDGEIDRHGYCIETAVGEFPDVLNGWQSEWMQIICFDVLEHQLNIYRFLKGIDFYLAPSGRVLFLVPVGKTYYDCGHVAFFPDEECLRNVLDYVFDVEEIFELKTCKKLFAACRKRGT